MSWVRLTHTNNIQSMTVRKKGYLKRALKKAKLMKTTKETRKLKRKNWDQKEILKTAVE